MPKNSEQRILWLIIAVIGGLATLGSLACLALAFLMPAWAPAQGDYIGFLMAGLGLLGMGLALSLLLAGLSAQSGAAAQRFFPERAWIAFLLLTILAVLIAVFTPSRWQTSPLFALFHLAVVAFPALTLFSFAALASGYEHTLTFRQLSLTLNGGALGTLFALPIEIIGFALSAFFVMMLALLFPGGRAEVERLMALIQPWLTNPPATPSVADMESLMAWVASPVVLGTLAMTLGVITPLVEELAKVLVLGVMGFWEKPSLPRAFLWGAACGLGFAIVEGFFNGAMGLGQTSEWMGGVGMRVFASAMHAFTSGLLGIGWGLFWQKRYWALPGAYFVAVAFHGLWNFNVVGMLGGASLALESSPLWGGVSLLSIGLQIGLSLIAPVILILTPVILKAYTAKRERQ